MEHPSEENQPPQHISSQHSRERPQVKIVRPSNRRKFLVALLGGAAVVGLGGITVAQTVQSLRATLNTKPFPFDSYQDLVPLYYSPDLNLMGLTSTADGVHDPRAVLSIWDYQQQSMTTLPTGSSYYLANWSPDNRYLLYHTRTADNSDGGLDLWDMRTRQRISSYADARYTLSGLSGMSWAPNSIQMALAIKDKVIVLATAHLNQILALDVSSEPSDLTWSPDNKKLALLFEYTNGAWEIQIWNTQTQQLDMAASFQGQQSNSGGTLRWSPDGESIAALSSRKLCILQAKENLHSFVLDRPDNYGNLAWSPDSRYLAVSSQKGFSSEFSVWDVVERAKARVLIHNGSPAPDKLAWSQDGKYIVSILGLYEQVSWPWP